MDNKNERFPLVDTEGNVIGSIRRGEAHDGSKKLHPVVHLHVINSNGDVFLQKRPEWKDVQPGKWDTACGGHVDYGESVSQALAREVSEELGLEAGTYEPHFLRRYVFESSMERELVNVFYTIYDGTVKPSGSELDGGRYWSMEEIESNTGKGVLTPNFEGEVEIIRSIMRK